MISNTNNTHSTVNTGNLPNEAMDDMKSVIMSASPSGSTEKPIPKASPPTNLATFAPWLAEEKVLSPAEKAAILIQSARDGQEIDIEMVTSRSRLCHRLRKKYHLIFRAAAWALLVIHIFDRPVWTFRVSDNNWKNGDIYPSFQMPYLPFAASIILTTACLLVLWFAVLLEFGFKRSTKFNYLTILFAIVLIIKSIAVLVNIINYGIGVDPAFSMSPVESLCILLVEYQYESNMGYLFHTLPKFTLLMLVLSSFICTYTALGFLIFDPTSEEAIQYFNFYGSAVWNMLMVLNGSDWPTPMMPAFTQNRLFCLYFFLYIIIVGWGLLNLVLGFIYLFFKLEQRQISNTLEAIKEEHFLTAFAILDVEEKGFLNYVQVDSLLEELFVYYEDTTTLLPTAEERYELILTLDEQSNGIVDEKDFFNLEEKCFGDSLKVLRSNKVKFSRYLQASTVNGQPSNLLKGSMDRSNTFFSQVVSPFASRQNTLVPRNPTIQGTNTDLDNVTNRDLSFQRAISEASIYGQINNSVLIDRFRTIETLQNMSNNKTPFQKFMGYVSSYKSYIAMVLDSVMYDITFDTIMFILGVTFLLIKNASDSKVLFMVYISFASFELISKWFVKGTFRCFRSYRQSADFVMTFLLFVVLIERNTRHLHSTYHNDFGAKALVLIRLFLFPRNIVCTEYFKAFRARHRLAFQYAFKGASHFSFLLLVLFVSMYAFASLGQQIFGGSIIKTGDNGEKINKSLYGESSYWPLNFNDMPSGFVTMFVLIHVNNMHVTTSGFVAVNGQWAELFFAAWYAIGVLFLLNVLTAAFLNEFTGYLEKLAVERRKAAALAVIAAMLTQHEKQNSGKNHNPDLSMGSSQSEESYVGMSAINRSLLLQLERDQRKANQALTNAPQDEQSGSLNKTLFERLFNWHTPGKSERKSESVSSNSKQNVSALLGSRSEDSYHDSYVSSINNSYHFNSSYNRPIQRVIRPIQPTKADIARQEMENDRASRFSKSIFESNSGRQKLNSWIKKYYPKSLTGKPAKRPSGTIPSPRSTITGNISLHERLMDPTDNVGKSSLGEIEEKKEEGCNSDKDSSDNLIVVKPDVVTSRRHSEPKVVRKSEVEKVGEKKNIEKNKKVGDIHPISVPSTPVTTTQRKRRGNTIDKSDKESPQQGGLSLFKATEVMPDSDSSDDDLDLDIIVDINVSGPEFKDLEDSFSINTMNLNPIHSENEDDAATPVKEIDEVELNTEFNSRNLSVNIQHEKNILKHLSAHNILPRKPKTSLLNWMYGVNMLSLHERAAVLIQFARDGEEHSIFSSERALVCYRYRSRFSQLFRFASFLYAFLRFFERPIWTYHRADWSNNAVFPMSGLPLLSPGATIAIKIPLLIVLLIGFTLELGYKESDLTSAYKSLTAMRLFRYVLTTYCIATIFMLLAAINMTGSDQQIVTITSAGSILYVLWFNRRSLAKFKIVLRIMPKLTMVLLAFFAFILIFAAFGPFIFKEEEHEGDDDQNATYFKTYGDSIWSIFVAITSSDYPNQIIPAYSKAREVFLYFFSFICIGSYFFLNIIIIIVLVQFQKGQQLHNDYQKASRQILLMRAFEILDRDCKGYLEKSDVKLLLDELYLHYSDFQKAGIPQHSARRILIDILDIDGDGKISVDDFLFFLDVTRIKLSLDNRKTFMERYFPLIVASYPFQCLKSVVSHSAYDVTVDILAVILIVTSLIVNRGQSYESNATTRLFTVIIIIIFVLEAISKLLVRGYANYMRSIRNRTDFSITLPMLILFIGDLCYSKHANSVNGYTICVRILQSIRVIIFPRDIRFLMYSQGISKLTRLLRRVLSKIYTLGLVFLCFGYVFASVGVFSYGGLIDRSPTSAKYEDLQNSWFGENGFWGLNFNDFMSACITLFCCLHVSDFDVITSGFTAVTSDWSRMYFTAWYVCGVLLMLNIIKAFFLGEFLGLFSGTKEAVAEADEGDPTNKSKKNSVHMRRRLITRLNKGHDTTNAPSSSGAGGAVNSIADSEDNMRRSSLSSNNDPVLYAMQTTSNPLNKDVVGGSNNSSAQSVFHITHAVTTPKDRTYSNLSSSSTSSVSQNVIIRPVSASRPIEVKEGEIDRDTFVLPIQRKKQSPAEGGGSIQSTIELQEASSDSGHNLQAYYQASDRESGSRRKSRDMNEEEEDDDGGETLRYFASTAHVKDLDSKGRHALKSRLRDLTLGMSTSPS